MLTRTLEGTNIRLDYVHSEADIKREAESFGYYARDYTKTSYGRQIKKGH